MYCYAYMYDTYCTVHKYWISVYGTLVQMVFILTYDKQCRCTRPLNVLLC